VELIEIAEPVREYFDKFEDEFEGKFHSQVPLVEQVVHYLAEKRGKRLRPLLVFLTARLHGELTPRTMSASLVVEMFHTATLVHDDVVDESALRRGARTVNDIWDNKISILIGDLLFSKTLASIVDLQDTYAVAILSAAAERITEGELLQIAFAGEPGLTEADYFDLISKKTAALFSASCQLGALTVGQDGKAVENMNAFGEHYGMAFQITDDLLDYLGDKQKLGKPTGNDLREGKITLPLIYALEQASERQSAEVRTILDRGIQSEEEIEFIVQFVKAQGGVDYSLQLVNQYTDQALNALDIYPDSAAKQSLIQLVHYSVKREK